jgi:hypothetical protein
MNDPGKMRSMNRAGQHSDQLRCLSWCARLPLECQCEIAAVEQNIECKRTQASSEALDAW